METILKTNGLTKRFGRKIAVNHVNMTLNKGDIYGFIGRNGAGKTTLMRMVLGTAFVSEGEMELFGGQPLEQARKRIGSLIEAPGLYKNCSALENMKRFAILYGGDEKKCLELLDFVGLSGVGKKKCGGFSLGMRQRLGIAIALLGDPEFLVLDEPMNGLDPAGMKEIRDLILKLNQEKEITVLISSHLLDELAKIVTKYGIINDGILIEEVDAQVLETRCSQSLEIGVNNVEQATKLLAEYDPKIQMRVNNNVISVHGHLEDSARINQILVQNGCMVRELYYKSNGLEDYFVERIGM